MDEEELLDIGQLDIDLGVDETAGQEVRVLYDVQECEGFEFPALLVYGIKFNDALRVLKSIKRDSYRSFDVWVDLEDGTPPVKQGSLALDVPTLLAMRYLGLNVTVYTAPGVVRTINLKNISELEDFV